LRPPVIDGIEELRATPDTPSTTTELPPPSHDPITADLDHTSDEFKTIIQEHYRRTPSLRKLADIHGVSRSTVHRIVQAQ
jgi:AraC-like DNA-binding protein